MVYVCEFFLTWQALFKSSISYEDANLKKAVIFGISHSLRNVYNYVVSAYFKCNLNTQCSQTVKYSQHNFANILIF